MLSGSWLTRLASGATLAFLVAAGPVSAQQGGAPVAILKDRVGNVLVSRGDALVLAAKEQRLTVGTRVLTTAQAKVTISYDNGCDVRLNENERFTVAVGPCTELIGQVESLGPAAGAIGGGTTGTIVGGGAAAGGAGMIAAGIIAGVSVYELTRKRPVSPN